MMIMMMRGRGEKNKRMNDRIKTVFNMRDMDIKGYDCFFFMFFLLLLISLT